MGAVWTIAEQREGKLKAVSFELLAVGRKLADELKAPLASVVLGDRVAEASIRELFERGADEVYSIMDPSLAEFVCETYSRVLELIIREYIPTVVLAAATTMGRTLMPYVAVKLHTGLTADCTELAIEPGTDNLLQTRPAIGGNIMATIRTPDHRPQLATVRPRSSKPLQRDTTRSGRPICVPFAKQLRDERVEVLGYRETETGFVNLEEADVVIAGGRGLKRGENFHLLRELADTLGGQIGASRDAVDRGWIGYPHQIGLSGKTISPRLYLGAGISGSIQHLAGIKTSETIVSVNIDPDATLHKVADFAVVGDLFEVIPELVRQLKGSGAGAQIEVPSL
ncbi:MAG TPA: electron transfer flavoprotein subunit alpha/FixB family protein, partial [Spirochaetia bacterium]|nr:electron transfer flavoprotein subunit alpha/FixB family protein [Spirochaetia bacterium]